MSDTNNVGKGLLVGFLAGGVVGAVMALLYAPKSGREFRDDIRSRTDDYLDEADRYIAEAKDRAKDLINEGKKKSDKIVSDAKTKSDELLKDAEKLFNEAKSKANSRIAEGKEALEGESTKLKGAVKAGIDAYKSSKNS
jgi:gas vesicle protein